MSEGRYPPLGADDAQSAGEIVPRRIVSAVGAGLFLAALAFPLHAERAGASENHRHHHRAAPRHPAVAYAPRYRYPAYPPSSSAWAIYQYLKDGTEWCWLPTEPCDNNHRMAN